MYDKLIDIVVAEFVDYIIDNKCLQRRVDIRLERIIDSNHNIYKR